MMCAIILKFSKVPGEVNIADLGTKALDPKRHQMLLQKLPLSESQSPAFLVVARASLEVNEPKGEK